MASGDEFRNAVLARFAFLDGHGFRHVPAFDRNHLALQTVTFLGANVGFIVSLDVRDRCVDLEVARVADGERVLNSGEGGYSSSLLLHLVSRCGIGFEPGGDARMADGASTNEMIDFWAKLLETAGHSLLSDAPDSLPAG